MRRSFIAVLGISLLGLSSAPAMARATATEISVSVPVHAADLENEAGLHALYTRVAEAANAVCDATLRDASPSQRAPSVCRQDVMNRAIENAGFPALVRYHAAVLSGAPMDQTTIASR